MQNVKVAIWGFGAMGSGMAEMLLNKEGVDIVGVCVSRPERAGKKMSEVLGKPLNGKPEVILTNDLDEAVKTGECDVVLVCTDSHAPSVTEKVIRVLEKKVNCITIAEEMAYTQAQYPELAKKIDECAKKNGVSALGTGINPGLMMDLLAVCFSGCMIDVKSVACKRVNSLSPFGATVMREQGVGTTVEQFAAGKADGSLTGHIGFAESIMMISDAIGLKVEKIEEQMDPIVTDVDRKSPHGFAKAGDVAGVSMRAQGLRDGKNVIDMQHPQQIEPEQVGVQTGDYITIEGTPAVHMANTPEIDGGLGTIAMAVNCIPQCINAEPGLRSMIDIPVPHAIMDDFRNHVYESKKLV
ncbi:NAD(P)-binding domain-containing protein [Ruminococcaceae bacterium OttesenSCG-928-A11]|nr:NAD(P)-binding domain-containing protein [Ruminococcaceae bacterium OttesenSCG-928-A11]